MKKMNYKIIAKYIKNLKFDIPNAKTFFSIGKNISNYRINIDIKSNQIKEKIIEIETSLNLVSEQKDVTKINTKIVFATIIELTTQKVGKEELEKIILIDVPSNVYSEMRKIFLFLFETSGFKEIKIKEDVNFEELYNKRKNQ